LRDDNNEGFFMPKGYQTEDAFFLCVLSEADSTFPIKFSLISTDDFSTQTNNPSSPLPDQNALGTDYYHKTLSCGP